VQVKGRRLSDRTLSLNESSPDGKKVPMNRAERRSLVLLLIISTGAGVLVGYLIPKAKQVGGPEPDLSSIQHYLEGTAERDIAPPTLSDAVVEIRVKPASLGLEVDRVKHLALSFGGSAIGDMTSGQADILAKVPKNAMESFTEAVRDASKPVPNQVGTLGSGKVFVEIKLISTG
jgi:hypothetical protein